MAYMNLCAFTAAEPANLENLKNSVPSYAEGNAVGVGVAIWPV
jgi:hypothetical protein